uniref:Putative zinc-finger domain-containing protein n=1 Tax=Periophthalmus magnuspinnatus TaxID=409849 RepID=A0A3B3ZWI3_9GOBI
MGFESVSLCVSVHGEPTQRSNFWERSHGALGRFRHARGGRGADWRRGGNHGNRGAIGRYGAAENHGNKNNSPSRKQKPMGRNQPRKPVYNCAKPETSAEESFEDLLSRYKEIQLELECIRKEETMALEPKDNPVKETQPEDNAGTVCNNNNISIEEQSEGGANEQSESTKEETVDTEKRVFQSFNIKPLRQKVPANLDELQKKWTEQAETTDTDKEEKTCVCCCSENKDKEEELSELQLRLLALQSASKKWHQKELQVMKKSKERITRPTQDKSAPSTSTKQAVRRQQLRNWKMKQQREQEETRRQEEEERRKREEEIRRIRDLSNQDEQYNRFMKLVGGKTITPNKSRDREHRKSTGKSGLDTSGNLYQYDNYDEVAMDTDSETSSPGTYSLNTSINEYLTYILLIILVYFFLSFAPSTPPPPPPLPPPDELEPPPKPPFADEEEEEEMLLRETCLMSMANKRVAVVGRLMGYVHLYIHSLNPAHCLPLVSQLPRHKAVVVSLNDSDDSDSDVDGSSGQSVFGGLEFMIREARRTVEAAKPKGASEKENNPMRTPEALPEAKKAEYRLLKEEIASREKQKMLASWSSASSVHSDSVMESLTKPSTEQQLTEAEQRLCKHRELLKKDEAVLKHLLQQELKKRESLRAAEAKVSKLREQLQASEKIANANRTLLRKLQEQVHRVEHRVSLKKTVELKLEQELSHAQNAAARGFKRKHESNQPSKIQRLDGKERHFAELIAQKQRLQQLESEYALKIQKLKEAQALRNKTSSIEAPSESPIHEAAVPHSTFPVSQPSLHDLTQDKLTLDTEDEAEESEHAPASVTGGQRRHSFRQSTSFTKPHLEQLTSTPAKDFTAANTTSASTVKLAKSASDSGEKAEVFAGLDVDSLKKRYQQQPQLGELLQTELEKTGQDLQTSPVTKVKIIIPVPYGPYHSPLLVFKSYRFSPYYRTKEKLSLSSVTYSNTIDPKKHFCRFDLTGTCNDDGCRWQHMRNVTLSGSQLFQDVLSYDLSLIGCTDKSSDKDISAATEKYIKKLFGPNNRMGIDQKAVLLVSKVNESKRHTPPFTTFKDLRRWRPKPLLPSAVYSEESSDSEEPEEGATQDGNTDLSLSDVCVTSEDRRYFFSETDDISNLEASVLESPCDTQLWIKLAFKYLYQTDTPPAECLEGALNTLSRALENNCDNPEVWSQYLSLFSKRGSRVEVQEMCEMAVEHAPDHCVWWTYLSLEQSFEGKDSVSERLLQFLVSEAPSCELSEKLSFQILEALLYRVQLSSFSGRTENALSILQVSLKSDFVVEFLTPGDRALLWLCFIHLSEFQRLPSSLYDASDSGPSRLVCRESFLLAWRTAQDICTPLDRLISMFQDGISQCSDDALSPSERTVAYALSPLKLLYLIFTIFKNVKNKTSFMWLHALVECPDNAEVFYHSCNFFLSGLSSVGGSGTALCSSVHLFLLYCGSSCFFLWLSSSSPVSRWQWLHSSLEDTVEAFERALGAPLQCDELHRLWMDYLLFVSSQQQQTRGSPKLFSDLVLRCLSTVPSRLEVPFNPAEFWSCYKFHNQVVSLYLSCLPPSQHALVLERLRYSMPNNTELGLRLLHQEWQEGNLQHLKFQSRMLSSHAPKCLYIFTSLLSLSQVRRLYHQALCHLPLCAALWKDRLLFEAAEGGRTDRLRSLVDRCQELGVSLTEQLDLVIHQKRKGKQ